MTLNGTSGISGGELDNSGTVTTTGTDTIGTETITNSDAIDVTGGTLTLSADTVHNNGSVTVSDGAALVAKDATTITNGPAATRLRSTAAGSLTLDDSSSISGGKVTIAAPGGKLTLNGRSSISNDALKLYLLMTLNGTSGISGGELNNSGTVTTTGTDTIGTETITNSDAIDVTGGTLTLDADIGAQQRLGDGIGWGGAGCQERHDDHQQRATRLRSTAAGSLTLDDSSSISGGKVTIAAPGGKLTERSSSSAATMR